MSVPSRLELIALPKEKKHTPSEDPLVRTVKSEFRSLLKQQHELMAMAREYVRVHSSGPAVCLMAPETVLWKNCDGTVCSSPALEKTSGQNSVKRVLNSLEMIQSKPMAANIPRSLC